MKCLRFKHKHSDEIIEIIQFNFDSDHNTLVRRNGEYEVIDMEYAKSIVLGENGKESNYLELKCDEK